MSTSLYVYSTVEEGELLIRLEIDHGEDTRVVIRLSKLEASEIARALVAASARVDELEEEQKKEAN